MLTDEAICSKIEMAFSPYRCVPEIWDYGHKLRFKVFSATDKPLITMAEVVMNSVRDPAALESLICDVQKRLEYKLSQCASI